MNKKEIKEILKLEGKEQEYLFKKAREIRRNFQGDFAYIRAIIEPSNYCRNHCLYCAMRKENQIERYRLNTNQIINIAEENLKHGINTFSLETGEDPQIVNTLSKAINNLKEKNSNLLIISGNLPKFYYEKLKDSGAKAYLLKFETSNPKLFERFRPGTTLEGRIKDLETLREIGFSIGTGNIVGLPSQTIDDIVEDVILVKDINPEMASVSPFISDSSTPLKNKPYGDFNLTLNVLALYRILLPNSQIPALCSSKFYGKTQLDTLNAGANDVLINTANRESIQNNFSIYSKNREFVFLDEALKIISKAELKFEPDRIPPLFRSN